MCVRDQSRDRIWDEVWEGSKAGSGLGKAPRSDLTIVCGVTCSQSDMGIDIMADSPRLRCQCLPWICSSRVAISLLLNPSMLSRSSSLLKAHRPPSCLLLLTHHVPPQTTTTTTSRLVRATAPQHRAATLISVLAPLTAMSCAWNVFLPGATTFLCKWAQRFQVSKCDATFLSLVWLMMCRTYSTQAESVSWWWWRCCECYPTSVWYPTKMHDNKSQSSKRSRSVAPSSVSSLGLHSCPACDASFDTEQSLRRHATDASANEACSAAVEYAFEWTNILLWWLFFSLASFILLQIHSSTCITHARIHSHSTFHACITYNHLLSRLLLHNSCLLLQFWDLVFLKAPIAWLLLCYPSLS